ncbi:MAG TPA: helix-turn-helix domain-containing protein [Cyclobacteriaceae bacterium]|nr:helix-turn-helix domain-containing protein [Cyclobacteriaceae bacterium]
MITISILALRNAVLASIADARYVFKMVNSFLVDSGREPLFNIQLVGSAKEIILDDGLFTIKPDVLMNDVKKSDLVIIPSLVGDMKSSVYINKEYAYWLNQQYKNGTEIASLCSGAFLVAYSGLLADKQVTTHWSYANEFKYFYPSIQLVDERVITDQNGLYSSGGSNAYWNLLLHLVEKFTNREMAIRTAKYFVIDIDRSIQSPFIIFHGLKDHDDDLIRGAQERIELHYREKLTVYQLADEFNLSRRTFERRFKKATRNTVTEYIQRVKVEGAKKQFEMGRKSINETMHDVGYSDIQAFRSIFKRITGMTPVEYRNKFAR